MLRYCKFKKNYFTSIRNLLILILIILTFLVSFTISRKFSSKLTSNMKAIVEKNLTDSLSNKFSHAILKKYNTNNLIELKFNSKNEISDINFDLEKAYELASEISDGFVINDFSFNGYFVNYEEINKKEIIMKLPVFYYSNNILISNIGPKIFVKLQYVRDILYELRTKVSNYGINSMLVELYLDFNIKSSVFFFKEDEFETNYSILLSSKVVSGQVPSIYGSTFEKQSEKENI